MSGLEIMALVLASAWLAILTVVVVLIVRQISLITVRLSLAGEALSLDDSGPEVGSRLPDEVVSMVPEFDEARAYLLLLSASCEPCRELAEELSDRRIDATVVALIPGRKEVAEGIADLLPSEIRTVLDPDAVELSGHLDIQSTPFALQIEGGIVSKKAHLYEGASDFLAFIEESGEQSSNGLVKITKKEAMDD
ncbi:MAG: hypothetical protein ACREXR_06075 [Gammaproteobacteria bacterium]